MKKFVVILISSVFIISSAKAQFDPQFSQNMNFLSLSNPAMISMDGKANIMGLNRQQWVGITNAPITTVFNLSLPFKINDTKHVGGLLFLDDRLGLFANQGVYLQYAYQRNMWDGLLNVGTNIGVLNVMFEGTKTFIPESNYHTTSGDPVIPTADENGIAFDMTLGVTYYDEKKYAGISLAHITNPSINIGEKATVTVRPLLYLTGGYNFFSEDALYVIKPSLFFKTDFASWQIDLNTIIEYKQRFYGGLSYRYQDAVVLLVGFKFSGVNICYSYDITTSKLARAGGGSHEVMLGYSFLIERSKRNRTKSVRIL